MKGGKCCKCVGGRGKWGSSCYDDPSNCCKKSKSKSLKKSRKMSRSKKTKKNMKK